MKTTIELPDDLFRRLKIRAAEEGRSMKEFLTSVLSEALNKKNVSRRRSKRLPIIKGGRPAKPAEELTPERVAEILWGSAE